MCEPGETDFDWDLTAVFTPPVEVAPRPHWPTLGIAKITVSILCMLRPESFGNKYLDSLANEFIPCIAKEGLNPFVYKDDLPVFVNHDHRIRRRIELPDGTALRPPCAE